MRKIMVVAALALALVGCGKTVQGPGASPLPLPPTNTDAGAKVQEAIKKVQAETRKYCKFVPTVATVANIANMFGVSSGVTIVDIAKQICNVVGGPGTVAARRAGKSPQVCRGGQCVAVRGHFVR